jgi:hypothetical protein
MEGARRVRERPKEQGESKPAPGARVVQPILQTRAARKVVHMIVNGKVGLF